MNWSEINGRFGGDAVSYLVVKLCVDLKLPEVMRMVK
jgi:hypothetical protein